MDNRSLSTGIGMRLPVVEDVGLTLVTSTELLLCSGVATRRRHRDLLFLCVTLTYCRLSHREAYTMIRGKKSRSGCAILEQRAVRARATPAVHIAGEPGGE